MGQAVLEAAWSVLQARCGDVVRCGVDNCSQPNEQGGDRGRPLDERNHLPRLERWYAYSKPLHQAKGPERRQPTQRLGEVAHRAWADGKLLDADEASDEVVVRYTACRNMMLLVWPGRVGDGEPVQLRGNREEDVGDGLAEAAILVRIGVDRIVIEVERP